MINVHEINKIYKIKQLKNIMKNLLLILSFSVVCIQVYPQVAIPYDNDTLFVHPQDTSGLSWGGAGIPIDTLNGAESTTNGMMNTMAIVAELDNGPYAAYYCDTLSGYGHSDWYLPSIRELDTLYAYKDTIGGFTDNVYLSSTESDCAVQVHKVGI
jgi:hypothetical protein